MSRRFADRVTTANGRHHAPPVIPPDKPILDAIADLRDWTTDTEMGSMSPVAGEALAALHHLYHRRDGSRALQAFAALARLEQRNGHGMGNPDIPDSHARCGKGFAEVISYLTWRVEDDFHKPLMQGLHGAGRAS